MNFKKVDINTAAPAQPQGAVLIIYTGGTVGMAYENRESHLVPFDFSQITNRVPELSQFNVLLTVLSLDEPIDSSNVSIQHWQQLAQLIQDNYQEYDGFVILHGTDTMAYSASALSFMLENLSKPVIFTGAQVPIGRLRTDARENLITALQIAYGHVSGHPLVPEVCIFFHSLLLRGNRAKKAESSYFNAFKSGNYPELAKAGIEITYNQQVVLHRPIEPLRVHQNLDDRVTILKLFPGITSQTCRSILQMPDLKGVVLETFGAGNAPTYQWFLDLLREAIERGVMILNVSQCEEGEVRQGQYETSKYLMDMGVIGGADISSEAAVTKLMFVLGQNLPPEETRRLLQANLRGEISIYS